MKYILLLGSNKGNREDYIKKGITFLATLGSITLRSSLYETSPVGMAQGTREFYNTVAVLNSSLNPDEMLLRIKEFEGSMGRSEMNSHMKPREIDIDILFADEMIINTSSLNIPHPEISNRKFVLEPLKEILPGYRHPISGKTIAELLNELKSDESVRLKNR